MISVPFELEQVEFGILIPGIPLPEKSQKEWGPGRLQVSSHKSVFSSYELTHCRFDRKRHFPIDAIDTF